MSMVPLFLPIGRRCCVCTCWRPGRTSALLISFTISVFLFPQRPIIAVFYYFYQGIACVGFHEACMVANVVPPHTRD